MKHIKTFERFGYDDNIQKAKHNYFTILTRFNELTANNDHTEAALLLAKVFGTEEEIDILEQIKHKQERKGSISHFDQQIRDAISNKYYYKLKAVIR